MENQDNLIYNWHAVYTLPRFEKKVNKLLEEKRIEVFLPLQKKLKIWKDRKKWVEEPLFRSYIFVNVSEQEYYEAINVKGAVKYVTFSSKAVNIPENQILALKELLDNNKELIVTSTKFKKGDIVTINKGVLCGFEGELINYLGKKRMLIRVEQIGCSVVFEVPSSDLE